MTYKVADGYNNQAGLAALDPQGRSDGVMPGRFIGAGDGHTYEDGYPSMVIEYLSLTEAQLDSLLTQFGLTAGVRSHEITIEAPRNHDRLVSNWNAIVKYPELTRDGRFDRFFWRNVRFRVERMVALDEGAYY